MDKSIVEYKSQKWLDLKRFYLDMQLHPANFARWWSDIKINLKENKDYIYAYDRDIQKNLETCNLHHNDENTINPDTLEYRPKNVGGRPSMRSVLISIPAAKEICAKSNTDRGKQYREYLVGFEEKTRFGGFDVPKNFSQALRLAADLNDKNEVLQAQNLQLTSTIQEQTPKVEAYDLFLNAKGFLPFAVAAKQLGYGRNELFDELRIVGDIRPKPSTEAYGDKVKAGYYAIKTTVTNGHVRSQTFITPKGMDRLKQVLQVKCLI